MTRLLVICPYPHDTAGSQRFRYELYLTDLKQKGYEVHVEPFWSEYDWSQLYLSGKVGSKAWGLFKAIGRRILLSFRLARYHVAIVHREATPLGPPILEWLLRHFYHIPFVYDFDDAIWLSDRQNEPFLFSFLKFRRKVSLICRWASAVTAGNEYLADFALRQNKQVFLLPTAVNTQYFTSGTFTAPLLPVIGWTGTHSTLRYLKDLLPVLSKLYETIPFRLKVICNTPPDFEFPDLQFVNWKKSTEVQDLLDLTVGLMPLPDEPWTRGKCGFKAIQYMSLGIPTVASPVGVNTTIIKHAENGFLPTTDDEWLIYLSILLSDFDLRNSMGRKAISTIENTYSYKSNLPVFMGAIENLKTI